LKKIIIKNSKNKKIQIIKIKFNIKIMNNYNKKTTQGLIAWWLSHYASLTKEINK